MAAASEVIGRRIGAALLDVLVLLVAMVLVGIAFGQTQHGGGHASVNLHGAAALLWGVLSLAYYFVTEAAWGATLGKRALGIRVARADGSRAGAGAIAGRTLLRLVDALPLLYLLGLIVVLVTPGKQRLGDLAAGTTVVPAG